MKKIIISVFFAVFCTALNIPHHLSAVENYSAIINEKYSRTIYVSNVKELMATERDTKSGDVMVIIKPGIYALTKSLWLTGDHICYRSESGERDSVILKGAGMNGTVYGIFQVAGKNFRVMDLSLGEVKNHGIQVHGERDADGIFISNVRFFNCREQMIKGSFDKNKPDMHCDKGIVTGSLFEYTAGKAFQYYCGGIDIHRGRDWSVTQNTFRNILSPESRLTEGAIHFWNRSEGTIVDSNIIINCDRGIMFGLDNSPHFGGRISNNSVHVVRDTGIYLCAAQKARVLNNTVYIDSEYRNAIEYRFNTIGSVIMNNLCNRVITSRNGGSAEVGSNITDARAEWFTDAKRGNLRPARAIDAVVKKGVSVADFSRDIEGTPRTGNYDIGAYEQR